MYAGMCLYLRPGEIVHVQCRDLGIPLKGVQTGLGIHTLTIAPSERGELSKTQTFDDTVIVDQPGWLGALLESLTKTNAPSSPLFRMDAKTLRNRWTRSCKKLNIKAHLYQLRHTGASADSLAETRPPGKIRDRGRWKTVRSQQRYSKGGAVQKVWHRLSPAMRKWCSMQALNIEGILKGTIMVTPPPISLQEVNLVR